MRLFHRFRHPNIIILSGYSVKGPQLCLVYEYMKNGSLEDHLVCKVRLKVMNCVAGVCVRVVECVCVCVLVFGCPSRITG